MESAQEAGAKWMVVMREKRPHESAFVLVKVVDSKAGQGDLSKKTEFKIGRSEVVSHVVALLGIRKR